MDKKVVIGDYPLHLIIRTLVLGLSQINGQVPPIMEKHIAESVVLVSSENLQVLLHAHTHGSL
jgi:hypothetical protein